MRSGGTLSLGLTVATSDVVSCLEPGLGMLEADVIATNPFAPALISGVSGSASESV